MSISPKRIFKIIGIFVLALGAILIVASFIVSAKLEEKISEKLQASGFTSRSISISLLKRSVELDSIVYNQPDTAIKNPHQLFLHKIKISGVHIYSFLKNREIIVDDIVIDRGVIQYNKNLKTAEDSTQKSKSPSTEINGIRIKHLSLTSLQTALLNDTLTETSVLVTDFQVSDFRLSLSGDTTYSVNWIDAHLEKLVQSKKGGLHSFSAAKIDFNSEDQRLEVDSFKIFSPYNKTDFARIAKIQKTRLDITLPKIVLEGIDPERMFSDSTLVVKRITIPDAVIHAYRDKNYPFIRDWIMPLPIEGIRRLPFELGIDSILIKNAHIAYEEFSEKGLAATGTITFNKVDASFAGLHTDRSDKSDFCTLVADCKVMNSGALHATFKFPLNNSVNYQAFGNVQNMDLKSLNPSLGNLTRIEIADGKLNNLYFNFAYNDNVSNGEVLINYTGLKLQALKKDTKSHEINKVLTTAINAIVKSDKDKTVDKSKRTGAIAIERDKKRFVFQFWWKSILDGLQSTFIGNGKKKKTQKRSSK